MPSFLNNTHGTVLEIDLNALAHNYHYIRSKIALNTKIMGVVKAFGYGSDAIQIALELERLGIDYFAVAYTKEGVALRNGGITSPILVLHPQPNNFEAIIKSCLEPTLYSKRVFTKFQEVAKSQKQENYPAHIKFNTGLNRIGFLENDIDWISLQLLNSSCIKITSLFSHLAASEDCNEKLFTEQQIQSFNHLCKKTIEKIGYKPLLHQGNTSGVFNYPNAHFNMVRVGIGLYGYGNSIQEDANLKPIASLKSVISQIHTIKKGDTVGYNRSYRAQTKERIATIPIGHADGISRNYGNGNGSVFVKGKRAIIIGNVCMDMLMINITDIDCKEGDQVTIIGKEQTASELAERAHSISYELLTALSHRIDRAFCRK